jgi:hypothetical protein
MCCGLWYLVGYERHGRDHQDSGAMRIIALQKLGVATQVTTAATRFSTVAYAMLRNEKTFSEDLIVRKSEM